MNLPPAVIKFKIGSTVPIKFHAEPTMSIRFHAEPHVIGVNSGDIPVYDGAYSVTPKVYEETTLETKQKLMQKNVTVSRIPQYQVSNDAEGVTLIIGEEYNNG